MMKIIISSIRKTINSNKTIKEKGIGLKLKILKQNKK
jgi:hypothetical protein